MKKNHLTQQNRKRDIDRFRCSLRISFFVKVNICDLMIDNLVLKWVKSDPIKIDGNNLNPRIGNFFLSSASGLL